MPPYLPLPLEPGEQLCMICPIYAITEIAWVELILQPVYAFCTAATHGEDANSHCFTALDVKAM